MRCEYIDNMTVSCSLLIVTNIFVHFCIQTLFLEIQDQVIFTDLREYENILLSRK